MTEASDSANDDRHASTPEPVHARFDWATTSPTRAVVETVARSRDADLLSLPPLFDNLDPDALDDLVVATTDPASQPPLQVSFSYAGTEVTVAADGAVMVRPA
ncbi:HalOD1 output domain-containing protein [Halobacteriales archaeon Cl-PHB]